MQMSSTDLVLDQARETDVSRDEDEEHGHHVLLYPANRRYHGSQQFG